MNNLAKWRRGIFLLIFVTNFSFAGDNDDEKNLNLAQTKYPFLFVHGCLGFPQLFGGLIDYFKIISEHLEANGAEVLTAKVSPLNSTEVRYKQLKKNIKKLQKVHGFKKINLICHSQGGLECRKFLQGKGGGRVASILTIGTPHKGSEIADNIAAFSGSHFIWGKVISSACNLLGHTISFCSGSIMPQNAKASLNSLTTESMELFNKKYPAGVSNNYCEEGQHEYKGARLFSVSGESSLPNNLLDIMGYVFAFSGSFFPADFDREEFVTPNDGLVSVCSSKFGKWLGQLPFHHLAFFGGVVSPMPTKIKKSVQEFFLKYARRLKSAGI
jgi:triacylglycerol lipase